jgi:diguanylate cyclase
MAWPLTFATDVVRPCQSIGKRIACGDAIRAYSPTVFTPSYASPLPAAEVGTAFDRSNGHDRDLRFVTRIHRMRTLGLGLGFFCVASVLRLHDAPGIVWAMLVVHGFAWPHVARYVAWKSDAPAACERHNLTVDSAAGGAWIALMHFSLLPSVLLATMLTVDKIAVGGPRFAARTSAFLVCACALTSTALGFPIDLDTPMSVVVACMPFLVAYPLAISGVTFALAQKIAAQNRWLAHVSTTDELTGLANRRQGIAAASHALALQRRHGGVHVLVALDVDRFKQVNDRYGHPAGDDVLRQIARTLRDCTRGTDVVARLAGDEFLLVLPETNLEGAAELAKRIRAALAAAAVERAPELRCTVSMGAAEAHVEMADVEDWIQQADAALYRAKAEGRDRLVCAHRVVTADRSGSTTADCAA